MRLRAVIHATEGHVPVVSQIVEGVCMGYVAVNVCFAPIVQCRGKPKSPPSKFRCVLCPLETVACWRQKGMDPAHRGLGVLICADMRYTELCRELAIGRGCDVLLHPTAFARDVTFASWPSFVECRALENQV